MSRIEGLVASVLNERELVLNVGSDQGVKVGMRFDILYPGGIKIPDPTDPTTILGSVEWPKTQVKVVQVYPNLAVGRTFRTITSPARGYSGIAAMAAGLSYTPERTTVETLRTDGAFAEKEIDPKDSLVKVGDPAVEVTKLGLSEDSESTDDE